MSRTPSPAAVRARALLTADPSLSPAAVLSQLERDGMHLAAVTIRGIARDVGRPADTERIPETRRLLLCLASQVGYSELHGDQPARGWREAVRVKLGLKSQSFVSQAWKSGVAPATRAKWSEIISIAALAIPGAVR